MPALLKGWCVHCRGRIHTTADRRDDVVECPHCGREMAASAAVEYRQSYHRIRRWIWLAVAAGAGLSMGVAGYLYRSTLLAGFDRLVDEAGSRPVAVACLAAALVVLVWVALWMALPILVYIGLKDLRRRAAELNETTKLCARHLARLTRSPAPPRNGEWTKPASTEPPPEGSSSKPPVLKSDGPARSDLPAARSAN
jgi:hypothetical protein